MELVINGTRETIRPCTIAELVVQKGLNSAALVIELNRTIIKSQQWPELALKDGDHLELLSFVGGG